MAQPTGNDPTREDDGTTSSTGPLYSVGALPWAGAWPPNPLAGYGGGGAGGGGGLESFRQAADTLIDPDTKWYAYSAGMLAPTRSGSFGEGLGNAMGNFAATKQKEAELRAQYVPLIANTLLTARLKQMEIQTTMSKQWNDYLAGAMGSVLRQYGGFSGADPIDPVVPQKVILNMVTQGRIPPVVGMAWMNRFEGLDPKATRSVLSQIAFENVSPEKRVEMLSGAQREISSPGNTAVVNVPSPGVSNAPPAAVVATLPKVPGIEPVSTERGEAVRYNGQVLPANTPEARAAVTQHMQAQQPIITPPAAAVPGGGGAAVSQPPAPQQAAPAAAQPPGGGASMSPVTAPVKAPVQGAAPTSDMAQILQDEVDQQQLDLQNLMRMSDAEYTQQFGTRKGTREQAIERAQRDLPALQRELARATGGAPAPAPTAPPVAAAASTATRMADNDKLQDYPRYKGDFLGANMWPGKVNPATAENLKAVNAQFQKDTTEANAVASSEGRALNRIRSIYDLASRVQTGGLADVKMEVGAILRDLMQSSVLSSSQATSLANKIAGGDLASLETLNKMAITSALVNLRADIGSAAGQRIAMQEFMQYLRSVPSGKLTPEAISRLWQFAQKEYMRDSLEARYRSKLQNAAVSDPSLDLGAFPAWWQKKAEQLGYTPMQVGVGGGGRPASKYLYGRDRNGRTIVAPVGPDGKVVKRTDGTAMWKYPTGAFFGNLNNVLE